MRNTGYIDAFGKDSHIQALESVNRLKTLIAEAEIDVHCAQRDITDMSAFPIKEVDIVITDIPYGINVEWHSGRNDPIQSLFENCYRALDKNHSLMVVIADKKSKLAHELFQRVEYFKLGKRQVAFFKPNRS